MCKLSFPTALGQPFCEEICQNEHQKRQIVMIGIRKIAVQSARDSQFERGSTCQETLLIFKRDFHILNLKFDFKLIESQHWCVLW